MNALHHPVTGLLAKLDQEAFLSLFSRPLHREILAKATRPGVEVVVCFEPLSEDPELAKPRSAVNFGPGCTYQTDRIAKGCRLGETLDNIKYPVAFWRVTPSASSRSGPPAQDLTADRWSPIDHPKGQ